jgi:hypothetical protein
MDKGSHSDFLMMTSLQSNPPQTSIKSIWINLLFGFISLLLALTLTGIIYIIYQAFESQPEKAVTMIFGFTGLCIILPATFYMLVKRQSSNSGTVGLIVLISIAILLVAIYFFWVSFYVKFPGDFLIWSESDFVNDILKFRVGYPLYTPQTNNDSFIYPPGTQLLTYLLAALIGNSTSIPVYRAIQVFFTMLSALLAMLCVDTILRGTEPIRKSNNQKLWWMLGVPVLFLFATNPLTNPFVHNLHNDALAQLISTLAFLLLLLFTFRQDSRLLIPMAILPAVGFLIKQNLAIWAILYTGYLAIFDPTRSFKKVILFMITSFGLLGMVYLGGYLIYGENFHYWIITVLGSHGVSPLRSFQHLVDVWLYVLLGLLGGILLLRGKNSRILIGPWSIWLALIILEIYSSGIAWMVNHIGPGSLLAGVWFIAALERVWEYFQETSKCLRRRQTWFQTVIGLMIIGLLFAGLGFIRIPVQPLPDDAYRYLNQIEAEFNSQPVADTLLDFGTWLYVKDKVIMKDRAACFGDRGYAGIGDFTGMIQRIEEKKYERILVRNFDDPIFWYDHYLFPKSSGIKEALLKNYSEVNYIDAVEGLDNYLFSEISVFVPDNH